MASSPDWGQLALGAGLGALASAVLFAATRRDKLEERLKELLITHERHDQHHDLFEEACAHHSFSRGTRRRGQVGPPKRLILIRHGESEANVDRELTKYVPDHSLHLTQKGCEQASAAGVKLKALLGDESVKFIVSPYVRTQETANGVLHAWGQHLGQEYTDNIIVRTDVRIRELEFGNFDENMKEQFAKRKEFGSFYYRFRDGESPADLYDRASLFVESLKRQWEDNTYENYVVVGHGTMHLVLLMRLFRANGTGGSQVCATEFNSFEKLDNTEIICLERPDDDTRFSVAFSWRPGHEKDFGGLRKKKGAGEHVAIWDGRPESPPCRSHTVRA